jgi:arabinose operon protein AraL
MYKGFIFDLDGTVYVGDHLVPGADRVIRLIRKTGSRVVFVSNKPLQTREDYAVKLTRLGIPTPPKDVVNSTFVLIRYLRNVAPDARVFVIGEPPLLSEMSAAGLSLTENPEEIDYVVAAFDRSFNYGKLLVAFRAIRRGAHFIATNPDRTCPFPEGELPDCAAVIAALEAVTGKGVEAIMGKPSPIALQVVLEVIGMSPEDCLLVGDRLDTDIRMALDSGMTAALVMTGVTNAQALETSPIRPHHVLPSIAHMVSLLGLKDVPDL